MRDQKIPGGLAAGKTGTCHPSGSNNNQTSARRHILRQTSHLLFLVFRLFFVLFSKAARLPQNVALSEGNKLKTKSIRTKISFTSEVIGITGLSLFTIGDFGGAFIFSLPKKQRNVFFKIVQPYFVKTAVI